MATGCWVTQPVCFQADLKLAQSLPKSNRFSPQQAGRQWKFWMDQLEGNGLRFCQLSSKAPVLARISGNNMNCVQVSFIDIAKVPDWFWEYNRIQKEWRRAE